MTKAVIKTGGKQYLVTEGQRLKVEKIEGEAGSKVNLDQVFLVSKDNKVTIGKPTVGGAKVTANIERQGRSRKVIGIKYKAKVRYRRKFGHRQHFTELKIEKITA